MNVKQIVFTKQNTAELLDVECGEINEYQVKVKTAVSSISCGTERANLRGDKNTSPYEDVERSYPRYTGYSSAGTVVEIGSKVTKVSVGDRVCMSWSVHKEYNIMDEENVVKLDESISFKEAALFHICTFPIAALRKTELEIGESALVMGLGILGLLSVVFARAAGAAPVIAVDPVLKRREKALELGADYAFDPFDKEFVEKVKAVTDGGVNVAIEVTGVGEGLNECLDCMAKFGRVSLLGCTRDSNFTVDYYKKVHGPGIKLVGAHTIARARWESSHGNFTQQDDIKSVMKLVKGRRIELETVVDAVFKPEECVEVYQRLLNDREFPAIAQFNWEC